jgi:hypothetical protein
MTSIQHPHPEPFSTTGPVSSSPVSSGPGRADDPAGVESVVFDPALHAAAVAERLPGAPVIAPGWWSTVTCPEDPRALELRHIPDLPARDSVRITELLAEVVAAGGACVGEAWEVLALWGLGSSPPAAAAGEAVMILVARAAEADVAAGSPTMPWVSERTRARLGDLLGRQAAVGGRSRPRCWGAADGWSPVAPSRPDAWRTVRIRNIGGCGTSLLAATMFT